MAIACAQCGAQLPEGTRFCGQCGATAPEASSTAAAAAPEAVAAPALGAPTAAPTAAMPPAQAAVVPAPAPAPVAKGTMIGAAVSPEALAAIKAAQQQAAAAQAAAAARPPEPVIAAPDPPAAAPAPVVKGTMIGAAVSPEIIAAARAQAQEAQARAAAERDGAGGGGRIAASGTMIGVPTSTASPAPGPAAAGGEPFVRSPLKATVPEVPAARARTMLGVAASSPATSQDVSSPEASRRIPAGGTMLGVAIPGIAPTAPGAAAAAIPAEPSGRIPPAGGTMLGVAIPGIAPTSPGGQFAPGPQAQAGAPPGRIRVANTAIGEVPVLPLPAPYIDDVAMPAAPVRQQRTGVPLAVVVAIVAGLVLVGGLLIFLLKPGAPPISGQPRLDAQGNQILHLVCENCPDGTTVELDTGKATFKAKEADLPLAKPLEVGENDLVLKVDRPGAGRDEQVKLPVPLGFYVRADLSDIAAKPPVITVRVAAAPATVVTVDGKPLALDASGKGAYALDVTSDTDGSTEEVRVIDKKIPYTVTLKGGPAQSGTVSARIAVVPLRLDEPSLHAVIESNGFVVAGQSAAGATVAIDGKPVSAQADGSFAESHAAGAGETSLEIRATAQGRAPRTVHLTVKKVASLAAEAKAADVTPRLTYDEIAPDIASKAGQAAVVAGEVVEARVTGHQTVALINDTRGCNSGPCLVRVVAPEDAKLARGGSVRLYGTVTRAVTTSAGKTVPEIAADFVVAGKR
jgi:hypothetical protein